MKMYKNEKSTLGYAQGSDAPRQLKHHEIYEEIENMGMVIEALDKLLNKIQDCGKIAGQSSSQIEAQPSLERVLSSSAENIREKRNHMLDIINQIDLLLF